MLEGKDLLEVVLPLVDIRDKSPVLDIAVSATFKVDRWLFKCVCLREVSKTQHV